MQVTHMVEWHTAKEHVLTVDNGVVPSRGDLVTIDGTPFTVGRIEWAIFTAQGLRVHAIVTLVKRRKRNG